MEFSLLCYAFFMEGVGWRYLSTYDPNLTNEANKSPENYVLNFFVTAIVLFVIGIVQYVLKYVVKFRKPLKIEEFTDLCAICNSLNSFKSKSWRQAFTPIYSSLF